MNGTPSGEREWTGYQDNIRLRCLFCQVSLRIEKKLTERSVIKLAQVLPFFITNALVERIK
jgi:hypothetical protein